MSYQPRNLRAISTPDQHAFDTAFEAYHNLARPGWVALMRNGTPDNFQVSSPLNDILEIRGLREEHTSEIWRPLAARALMSKLKTVGLDGKVVDSTDLMGSPDQLAIAFDAELWNYYDLLRPVSWKKYHPGGYNFGHSYFDSTSPLFYVIDHRECRSDWTESAWGALVVWGLKGKLMEVGCGSEDIGRESVVAVRPI